MPRPYRAMIFYCPVGRGDPTPPGDFAATGFFCDGKEISGRFVGDGLDRSVRSSR